MMFTFFVVLKGDVLTMNVTFSGLLFAVLFNKRNKKLPLFKNIMHIVCVIQKEVLAVPVQT